MPSKFSNRMWRRGPLSSKRGNANYYKGYGARTEGNHTSKGAFVMRPERLMNIVVPANFSSFQLKPYVHAKVVAPSRGNRVPDWQSSPNTLYPDDLSKILR